MKKRFYIYSSWREMFELLSVEERSTMLLNLFNFQEGIEPILDTSGLKITWASMKFLLDKDAENYKKKCNTMKSNAINNPKLGNNIPNIEKQVPGIEKQLSDIRSLSDNDNVNDNVNDKANENGEENKANEGDKDKQWFLEQLNKGISFKELNTEYPMSASLNLAVKEWIT